LVGRRQARLALRDDAGYALDRADESDARTNAARQRRGACECVVGRVGLTDLEKYLSPRREQIDKPNDLVGPPQEAFGFVHMAQCRGGIAVISCQHRLDLLGARDSRRAAGAVELLEPLHLVTCAW
jgi:hypothetical protein